MTTSEPVARIGPNAIIQMGEALRVHVGPERTAGVFVRAGLSAYLSAAPEQMVDENEVIALHAVLRRELDPTTFRTVSQEAGHRTADYLLAHRIPKPAQRLLRWLPPPLASRALLAAIRRHAWTFTGSGRFEATAGHPTVVSIADCPICRGVRAARPLCDYYRATFERLFAVLVAPHARALETQCQATGAAACVFEIRWDRGSCDQPS